MATSTSSCFLIGTVVGCANNRRCGSPPPHQKQVNTLSRILAAFSGVLSVAYAGQQTTQRASTTSGPPDPMHGGRYRMDGGMADTPC